MNYSHLNKCARLAQFAVLCSALTILTGCLNYKPVPIGTIPRGRPASTADEQYGHQVLTALQKSYPLDYNDPRYDQIARVVDRLTKAASANNDPWQVFLFKAPQVKNAAATRGNHVFVWSGMLDVTKTDGELATVLAHEVAHVIAGHTEPNPNEELIKILLQVGAIAAGTAVSQSVGSGLSNTLGDLTASVTNEVGNGILIYPYSREMEYEADQIGLFLMAKAGYDPRDAVTFWEKASRDPDMQQGLSFLSSHPDIEDRLRRIRELLPRVNSGQVVVSNTVNTPNLPATNSSREFVSQGHPPPLQIPDSKNTYLNQASSPVASNHVWRVSAAEVRVYSEPIESSDVVSVIKHGEEVKVKRIYGYWLEISGPVSGFIRAYQAQP